MPFDAFEIQRIETWTTFYIIFKSIQNYTYIYFICFQWYIMPLSKIAYGVKG